MKLCECGCGREVKINMTLEDLKNKLIEVK